MRISRLVLIVVAVVGVSLQSGCSSHRLREGIWELSFHGMRVENRLEFPLDKREVTLLVEWKDAGDIEVVEITSVEDGFDKMYGDIKVDKNKTVLTIDHQDDDWRWRMYGVIRDEATVMGQLFVASHRQYEDLTIEGRWDLQWLRDS